MKAVTIPIRNRRGRVVALALVDMADVPLVSSYTWRLNTEGYARAHTGGRFGKKVLMHRLLLGLQPGDGIEGDHRNRNRLDCQRRNLRVLPRAGNRQNRSPNRNTVSGERGVVWDPMRRKWQARAQVAGRRAWLGRFDTCEAASAAARRFRLKHLTYAVD